MGSPKGKSNLDKHNDAIQLLSEEQAKYDAMPKKELKSAIAKAEKIEKLKEQIAELEPIKDQIELSETCKSYLAQKYVLEKYGRVKEVSTKQMKKGVLVEDDSIAMFCRVDGNIYDKNEFRIKNDFIAGTPDLFDGEFIYDGEKVIGINANEIIDIKSSWDIFTFFSNIKEPMNDIYYWQLQGYMALTGAKIGTLAYCLVDTPDSIVEGEKYNLLRNMDVLTEEHPKYKIELEKLLRNRYFTDIPENERVLTVSIDRNDEDIEKMYRKVEKCREFITEFEREHINFSKHRRKSAFRATI